jgi:hypothetical protein
MSIDPSLLLGDLVSSARQKLLTALTDADLVGPLIGADPSPTDPFYTGWVFSGMDHDGAPSRDVTNTGKVACVLLSRNAWGSNMHNTARLPILTVLTYADATRFDGTVSRAAEDAELKAKAVAKVVRKTFHDAANEDHIWPLDLFVVSSVANGDLDLTDVPGSDYVVRGTQRFDVILPD